MGKLEIKGKVNEISIWKKSEVMRERGRERERERKRERERERERSDVVVQHWKCPQNQNGNVITPDNDLSPGLFHAITSNMEERKIDRK